MPEAVWEMSVWFAITNWSNGRKRASLKQLSLHRGWKPIKMKGDWLDEIEKSLDILLAIKIASLIMG